MQDFLRNNRGINDGADLPEDYLTDLYNRIVNNEIKMKALPFLMLPCHSKLRTFVFLSYLVWLQYSRGHQPRRTTCYNEPSSFPRVSMSL